MLRSWELPVRICVLEKKKEKKRKELFLWIISQSMSGVTDSKVGSEKISFQSFRKTVAKTRKYTFEEISGPFEQSLLRSKRDRMLWRALITHTWTDFLKMTFGSLVGEHEDRTRCYSKLICEMSLNQRTPSGAQSLYCLYKERLRRYVETK